MTPSFKWNVFRYTVTHEMTSDDEDYEEVRVYYKLFNDDVYIWESIVDDEGNIHLSGYVNALTGGRIGDTDYTYYDRLRFYNQSGNDLYLMLRITPLIPGTSTPDENAPTCTYLIRLINRAAP